MSNDKGDLIEDIIKQLKPLFENPKTTDKELVEDASRLVRSISKSCVQRNLSVRPLCLSLYLFQ